jgi:integrase/recombinase XerD
VRRKKAEALSAFEGAEPGSLRAFLAPYREALQVRGGTSQGVRTTLERALSFVRFCEERGLHRAEDVTRLVVERYQRHLYRTLTASGRPLALRTQRTMLYAVMSFFKWLCKGRHLLHNPASEIDLPRLPRALPKAVLTPLEVEAVLMQPNLTTPWGLRDRAMLELLYSSGIRRMEVANLRLDDIDLSQRTLYIREGKGREGRVLPLGERAAIWIQKYLLEARGRLVGPVDEGYAFINRHGHRFYIPNIGLLARRHVESAGIGKKGACHLFRHTCATLMLEGGADIRYVQAMLGHASLETTQIYTRVNIQKLREVHARTHPAEQQDPDPASP